ncbi:unnamed protein product [Didymodactylos carnosus]|uniref:Cation efflux protein cytoplasmic domain-containing protein n=1 Tax=Didymodactylos carnosus TaxID=1234261 RepID=A0A8S2FU23_9BILA|nr:unnamed protein product [Didymodactylos carnosus]CAF4335242.1 unnamed protein product [Didymodactylos carnosus]
MYALAEDHRNDVASNIVALACGLLGSFALRQKINQKAIVIDPVGAIVISQIKRLSGFTAKPEFLQQVTWVTLQHSPLITKIDTVRAFHFGTSFLVEVDIVLPEVMSLKEAHDIGEQLQKKLEDLPEVERAFVHLDYEVGHKANEAIIGSSGIDNEGAHYPQHEAKLSTNVYECIKAIKRQIVEEPTTPVTQVYNEQVKKFRRENGSAATISIFDTIKSSLYTTRAMIHLNCPNHCRP